jgi:DNA-directed RNA polymerase subunit F
MEDNFSINITSTTHKNLTTPVHTNVANSVKKHTAPQKVNLKKNQNISIDEKHTLLMNEFDKDEKEVIPKLKAERLAIKNKMKSIFEKYNNTPSGKDLDDYLDYYDKYNNLTAEIKKIKEKKKKYLLDNSVFIFNYFEEKKNISRGGGGAAAAAAAMSDGVAPPAPAPENNTKKTKALKQFFKIKTANPENPDSAPGEETIMADKYKNARQYWANVNNQIVDINDFIMTSDICQKCRRGELISQEEDGILICNNCGVYIQHITDCEKPSYKEPPSEVSYTAYLRLNHFKEILSQFQAKETTQIPDEVIEAIRNRIKKERITDISEITYTKTRDILRKLGFNKYFEHIQYINCKFGICPPTMSEELIETLCVLFIEIQGPWALHCPPNRTNFFNYAYTLYQLCNLLDQTQFLPFIPRLKDFDKQREADIIWKKVCNELGWYYYPTI